MISVSKHILSSVKAFWWVSVFLILLKFVTHNYGDMDYTFIKLLGNPIDLT